MGARINDFALSAHFRLREFECRCCGTVKLSARLVERLEVLHEARGELHRPTAAAFELA